MNIPKLKKIKTTKNYHGIPLEDDYSWVDQPDILEVLNDSKKLNTEVKDYIQANNKITENYFADVKTFQKNLFDEIKGKIKLELYGKLAPITVGNFIDYVYYSQICGSATKLL